MCPKTILLTKSIADLEAYAKIYARDGMDSENRREEIAGEIEKGNVDFVVSALKPLAWCPQKVSMTVKNGILCGLNRIPYSIEYVGYIFRWFVFEECENVLFDLLDYFLEKYQKNKEEGTFFHALNDSMNDKILAEHIVKKVENSNKYGLKVTRENGTFRLETLV